MRSRLLPLTSLVVALVLGACGASSSPATTGAATPPPPLPPGTDTLTVGETWGFELFVGCGEFVRFNGTWWEPVETAFTHPDYPQGWPVEILDLGEVDGPDAAIDATITLVAADSIEMRLADGTPVATYAPTGDVFLCG